MANINVATSLGVPGVADAGSIQQDQLQVAGQTANRNTNRYTDLSGANIDSNGLVLNSSLTSQDIQYWFDTLSTDGTGPGTARVTSTNDVFNILYTDSAQSNVDHRGLWTITNGRIIRRTTGGLYIFGRFNADGQWRAIINGLDIFSDGSNITFHTGGLDVDNSTIAGVRLLGNSTGQLNARSAQFGFAAGNVADTQAFDNGGNFGGNLFGYSIRFVHQLVPTSNVPATDAGAPQEYALYTNPDLTGIVQQGSAFSTDSNNARQSVIQLNRLAAVWLLNPNMANQTGEANAGRNLLVGFHSANPPNSVANAAEIRTLIADRQTFQDSAGNDVAATKVRYSADTRLIPATYARATVPTVIANNETTVNDSNHRGVMVLSERGYYNNRTSSGTTGSASRNPNLAQNQLAPLRTNITRTVRNFRYDYIYESNLVYSPDTMTGLVTATPTRNEGVDLNEFLNNRTATSSLGTISDFADEYASLRATWYNAGTPLGEMPVTASGTTLTYNRNVSYQDTLSPTPITSGTATVVLNSNPAFTGTITGRDYGSNTVNWGTYALPSGLQLSGGTHNNFNTTIDGITFVTEPTFNLTDGQTINLNNSSGNVTFNLASGTATINRSNYTGTITRTGGGTINLPVPVANYTVTPEIPTGFTGNGRFLIKQVGGSVVNTRDITNGVIGGSDFSIASDSTVNYIAYYKLDGDLTSTPVDYNIAIRSFRGTDLSANTLIASVRTPDVFTAGLTNPGTQSATFSSSTSDAINLTWSADFVDSAEGTAAQIVIAKNSDNWIDWHAANDFTVEYYSLGSGFSGAWNNSVSGISGLTTTQGVIFISSTGAQRQVTQQTGFNSRQAGTSPNTYPEVISANVGNAPISVVIAAVDGSTVGTRVGDVHNFLGFVETNPLIDAPAGGFDSSQDYSDNIERT